MLKSITPETKDDVSGGTVAFDRNRSFRLVARLTNDVDLIFSLMFVATGPPDLQLIDR